MSLTTFEEFKQLALRGTFVPVCKEVVADLLTPVSAFLKVAEHSDYAFLLESVEGGERVARYSFLGKDPFLVLRSRAGRTLTERAGSVETSDEPFVSALRRVMSGLPAPYVPGLPRFTGGAVGYFGYDASPWFEPALQPAWAGQAPPAHEEDPAVFMVFDTILAFDHVRHRILLIANAQITPEEDLEALYQFACARIGFLERELERSLSHSAPAPGGSCFSAAMVLFPFPLLAVAALRRSCLHRSADGCPTDTRGAAPRGCRAPACWRRRGRPGRTASRGRGRRSRRASRRASRAGGRE